MQFRCPMMVIVLGEISNAKSRRFSKPRLHQVNNKNGFQLQSLKFTIYSCNYTRNIIKTTTHEVSNYKILYT